MREEPVCLPPLAARTSPTSRASLSPVRPIAPLSGLAAACFTWTVASSFSQMRGTAKKKVGWISRRFAGTVSIDSAKLTWMPVAALFQVVKMRSATWLSGR